MSQIITIDKERIIQELSVNCNAYNLSYIKYCCHITAEELKGKIRDSKGKVRDEVLLSWNKCPKILSVGNIPTLIPTGTTEVYFWGGFGVGRTSIVAALLNAALRMGVYMPRAGEGLGFMTDLASCFNIESDAPAVPYLSALSCDTLQSLPLSLFDIEGGKEHKLSIVVSSSEVVERYLWRLHGKEERIPDVKITFDILNTLLKDKTNPKCHFFVLDSHPCKFIQQTEVLQSVIQYFQENDIFNSTTEGVSIIVTKCDQFSTDSSEWPRLAIEYVKKNFPTLLNTLKKVVGSTHEGGLGLNDGKINIIPFSVGELFFEQLFLFNPEPAKQLVKFLIKCTKASVRE